MRRMLGASALLLSVVLTACDDEPKPQPVTWHKDVGPLVQQKCGGCHVEGGIAPSALRTYAQAHAQREAIKSAVQSRHLPPWPPSNGCAQYLDDRSDIPRWDFHWQASYARPAPSPPAGTCCAWSATGTTAPPAR